VKTTSEPVTGSTLYQE